MEMRFGIYRVQKKNQNLIIDRKNLNILFFWQNQHNLKIWQQISKKFYFDFLYPLYFVISYKQAFLLKKNFTVHRTENL